MPFRPGSDRAREVTSNFIKENHQWRVMVSGKRSNLLDAASQTFETSTLASTGAGHKAVSLVAMPSKKV